MKRLQSLLILFFCLGLLSFTILAQDALNLPTELYILLNDGQVQRYGLGADGVQTVTPEGAFVVDFGIADDDNWFAYRTPDGLFISNVYDSMDAQLVDESADVPPIRGNGNTLVWSPDDRVIAYVTLNGVRVYFRDGGITDIPVADVQQVAWSPSGEFLLAETSENIWWIYRLVGEELPLSSVIPSSQGVTWLSDSILIFAPPEGGLFTMDLNDNNAQTTLLNASQVYALPYQVDESLYRVFAVDTETNLGSLVVLQVDGNGNVSSEVIGEGTINLSSGVAWSPGGNLLIAFQGGVMALVDPNSGQGFTLPITSAVSYDWGRVQSNVVDVLSSVDDIYFLGEDVMGILQVWTFAEDGNPYSLTPATGDIDHYDISPDGNQIAYVSQNQLWVYDRADEDLISLAESREPIRHPQFSPDGGRIAYSVDTVETNQTGGIWIATIADEENLQILSNGSGSGNAASPPYYHEPQWASNINALLVKASGSETISLSVLDVNTSDVVPIGQYDDGFWLRDGRVVAWGRGGGAIQVSEIVILDPNTQQDPIPLFTLTPDIVVEHLSQVSATELRLITRQNMFGPSPKLMIRIPINGTFEPLFMIPPITMPVISSSGDAVAGVTHPGGRLVVYSSDDVAQQILNFPSRIHQISWK